MDVDIVPGSKPAAAVKQQQQQKPRGGLPLFDVVLSSLETQMEQMRGLSGAKAAPGTSITTQKSVAEAGAAPAKPRDALSVWDILKGGAVPMDISFANALAVLEPTEPARPVVVLVGEFHVDVGSATTCESTAAVSMRSDRLVDRLVSSALESRATADLFLEISPMDSPTYENYELLRHTFGSFMLARIFARYYAPRARTPEENSTLSADDAAAGWYSRYWMQAHYIDFRHESRKLGDRYSIAGKAYQLVQDGRSKKERRAVRNLLSMFNSASGFGRYYNEEFRFGSGFSRISKEYQRLDEQTRRMTGPQNRAIQTASSQIAASIRRSIDVIVEAAGLELMLWRRQFFSVDDAELDTTDPTVLANTAELVLKILAKLMQLFDLLQDEYTLIRFLKPHVQNTLFRTGRPGLAVMYTGSAHTANMVELLCTSGFYRASFYRGIPSALVSFTMCLTVAPLFIAPITGVDIASLPFFGAFLKTQAEVTRALDPLWLAAITLMLDGNTRLLFNTYAAEPVPYRWTPESVLEFLADRGQWDPDARDLMPLMEKKVFVFRYRHAAPVGTGDHLVVALLTGGALVLHANWRRKFGLAIKEYAHRVAILKYIDELLDADAEQVNVPAYPPEMMQRGVERWRTESPYQLLLQSMMLADQRKLVDFLPEAVSRGFTELAAAAAASAAAATTGKQGKRQRTQPTDE
jgi:hypothetical protein